MYSLPKYVPRSTSLDVQSAKFLKAAIIYIKTIIAANILTITITILLTTVDTYSVSSC